MTPAQDPFAAYQPSAEPEPQQSPEKVATNRKVAVLIGGTTLIGASLTALAWGMSRTDPEETSITASVRDEDLRIDKEGAIRAVPDTGAGTPPPVPVLTTAAEPATINLMESDIAIGREEQADHSFSDAFRDARSEKGPGKFFTWHGNLYSTNYKEEWEEKPDVEQKTYFAEMGLPDVEPVPEPVVGVPEPDHPSLSIAVDEAQDGIPVSIEELKNAEYSSDKITIVDAITLDDSQQDLPLAIQLADDPADNSEWVHHDTSHSEDSSASDFAQIDLPSYDSSMADDMFDDDDQDSN